MTEKDLHIILLNYLAKDDVLRALESIIADIRDIPYDIAITVSDNSQNKDGIKDALAERFPQVCYADCVGNLGFGKGVSEGGKTIAARYYFVLGSDTMMLPRSRTIERIIAWMDSEPKVGAMSPKLLNMNGTLQYSCYRFDWPSIFIKPFRHLRWDEKFAWVKKRVRRLNMADFSHDKTRPVDWILGAAMVVRNVVIDEIGWFDPRYFMYMEDCDWCRTMWEHGWSVYYVHDIALKHEHNRASAKVPGVLRALVKNKLARAHLKSWLQYLWKWRGTFRYYGKM